MQVILGLVAIGTVVCLGAAALPWLWLGKKPPQAPEFLAWSWILGALAMWVLLTLSDTIGLDRILTTFIQTLAAASLVLTVRRKRAFYAGLRPRRNERAFLLGCTGVGVITLVCALLQIRHHCLTWDGLFMHEIRARAGFMLGHPIPAELLTDVSRHLLRPSYPILVSFLEFWMYSVLGSPDQRWAQALFPVFIAAGAVLLCSAVRRSGGSTPVAIALGLVPLAMPNLVLGGAFTVRGFADVPLAAGFMGVAYGLIPVRVPGEHRQTFLASLAAAMCVATKQEGVVLLVAAAVCFFIVAEDGTLWRRIGAMFSFALPGIAVWVVWAVIRYVVQVLPELTFETPTLSGAVAHADRLGFVLGYLFRLVRSPAHSSILWPIVLVAFFSLRKEPRLLLAFAALILLPLGAYLSSYLFTTCDLRWHVDSSLYRLVWQISLVACLLIGTASASGRLRRLEANPAREFPEIAAPPPAKQECAYSHQTSPRDH